MVIWIYGLSGSGKTTAAQILLKKLKNYKFIHIDGDIIRKIYNDKLGYSENDREKNASRISKLVKFLSDQNVNLIVSVLSNYPTWLLWNRKNLKKYYEIYMNANFDILKKRRSKIYSGKIKNVVGLDIKYKIPKKYDFIINNNFNDKKKLAKELTSILRKLKI